MQPILNTSSAILNRLARRLEKTNQTTCRHTNLFNLISDLQSPLFFGGFWNCKRKKPLKKRRNRQILKLFNSVINSVPIQFIKTKRPVTNTLTSYSRGLGSRMTTTLHLLRDYKKGTLLLNSPVFVVQYLSLRSFFNKPLRSTWVKSLFSPWSATLSLHFFNDSRVAYTSSNLLPKVHFKKTLTRKLLKLFKFHRFSKNVTMWYYNMLIRFLESCTGKKVYIKFNPFLENYVSFSDSARCAVWLGRIRSFQRILGPKIFLHESLKILCISIRSKDPTLLAS